MAPCEDEDGQGCKLSVSMSAPFSFPLRFLPKQKYTVRVWVNHQFLGYFFSWSDSILLPWQNAQTLGRENFYGYMMVHVCNM